MMNLPSILPTRTSEIGPLKGASVNIKAVEAAKILAIAYAIEYGGLRGTFLPVNSDDLQKALEGQTESSTLRSTIREMVGFQLRSSYPGFLYFSTQIGIVIALVATLWLWSLGWVFGSSRGGFFKRVAKMVGVALLFWPVSLVVWRFWSKK
jgi:hypothetical protein